MSSRDETILVTGATGQQGGAAAEHLLADGWRVRALVRDPRAGAARALSEAGAELVVGDFDEPSSLAAATAGVHGVFGVPPAAVGPNGWDTEREVARGAALVDAARAAGVGHFVFTGVGSLRDNETAAFRGKFDIEKLIVASGMRHTLLRPVRFMENYLARNSPLDGIKDGVHHHLFAADRPMQVIAVTDIGAIAARVFGDPERFGGEVLELAGDDPTPVAAIESINRATGLRLRYRKVTVEEAAAINPVLGKASRAWGEGNAWHADIAAIRSIHPGLLSLDDWLESGGAARIRALSTP